MTSRRPKALRSILGSSWRLQCRGARGQVPAQYAAGGRRSVAPCNTGAFVPRGSGRVQSIADVVRIDFAAYRSPAIYLVGSERRRAASTRCGGGGAEITPDVGVRLARLGSESMHNALSIPTGCAPQILAKSPCRPCFILLFVAKRPVLSWHDRPTGGNVCRGANLWFHRCEPGAFLHLPTAMGLA